MKTRRGHSARPKNKLGMVRLAEVVAGRIHDLEPARRPTTAPQVRHVDAEHVNDAIADRTPPPTTLPGSASRSIDHSISLTELIWRADHDELTGLANRARFIESVETDRSSTQNEPAALFIIDLDEFKAVNDTWGHNEGDIVLQETSRRLESIAAGRGIAARLGGDEFAIAIPSCRPGQAQTIAKHIVTLLSEPIPGDLLLTVGASVGWVSHYADKPASVLMSHADAALYAVKERGGHGHQQFNQELAAARLQGRLLQREIRHGMRVGQFKLAKQSIVDLRANPPTSAGAEILCRWQHPRRGLLQPDEFLPAVGAAASGEVFDIHIFGLVLERLAHDRHFIDAQSVWVNLSSASLNMRFVFWIRDRLEQLDVDPSQIVIEISEDASVESAQASAAIEGLAMLGLRIALDDFGSGYAHLGAIKRLPIDYIKIDRLFTTDLAIDPRACAATEGIISLIRALGAEPVAEGIERQADADIVYRLGCNLVQGFLWERPTLLNNQAEPAVSKSSGPRPPAHPPLLTNPKLVETTPGVARLSDPAPEIFDLAGDNLTGTPSTS